MYGKLEISLIFGLFFKMILPVHIASEFPELSCEEQMRNNEDEEQVDLIWNAYAFVIMKNVYFIHKSLNLLKYNESFSPLISCSLLGKVKHSIKVNYY